MELIIHPHELTDRWIELAKELKLDRLSLHPVGGKNAHETLQMLLDILEDPAFLKKIDRVRAAGIGIGYEFHALSFLLPRDLFETHPEYFRMDAEGNRVAKGNFCFSNKEARRIICENAVALADKLYGSDEEYYFWLDDATKLTCHCEECKKHNFAHHQLVLMNEIAAALQVKKPGARVCYLAYYEGVAVPDGDVRPAKGIFLEYAPFERYTKPETFSFEGDYLQLVKDIVAFFGTKHSKVLEYWYDNSIYYRRAGKKPVPFSPKNDQIRADFEFYKRLGFQRLSSFACNLCDEYVSLFGDPDFSALK